MSEQSAPATLYGLDSRYLVEDVEIEETVTLGWCARLLSKPWRPWAKTRLVKRTVSRPSSKLLRMDGAIVGHPETLRKVYAELEVR